MFLAVPMIDLVPPLTSISSTEELWIPMLLFGGP
jgi:hypothetical protein